jgi:hypothetical protein
MFVSLIQKRANHFGFKSPLASPARFVWQGVHYANPHALCAHMSLKRSPGTWRGFRRRRGRAVITSAHMSLECTSTTLGRQRPSISDHPHTWNLAPLDSQVANSGMSVALFRRVDIAEVTVAWTPSTDSWGFTAMMSMQPR